jgi:hypothetical protein
MNYLIVKNNKAPYKGVFEYLEEFELRNPTSKQKQLLTTLCDGIEFYKVERLSEVKDKMTKGDYLYYIDYKGKLELESICT